MVRAGRDDPQTIATRLPDLNELAMLAHGLDADENPGVSTLEVIRLPLVAGRHRRRFPTYLLVDDRGVIENPGRRHLGRLGRNVPSRRHSIFDRVRNISDVESLLWGLLWSPLWLLLFAGQASRT